jgi:hypothetical protein
MGEPETFWRGLWIDIGPGLRAQYADALLGCNLLVIMILPFLVIRAMKLLGFDADALSVISFLHTWSSVVVFASFLTGVVFRAVVGIKGQNHE